jgi:hypothetical protein
MNYTQMAEGFIQIPEEKWDAVQAELLALRKLRDTTIPNLNAEWSEKLRVALKEAAALREKYSTVCEPCWGSGSLVTEFADHTMAQGCPKCHGTGRVMMLDAEGVKAEFERIEKGETYDVYWSDFNRLKSLVLKGGSQ